MPIENEDLLAKEKVDKMLLKIFNMFDLEDLDYSSGITVLIFALHQCIEQTPGDKEDTYERFYKALKFLKEER